MPPKPTAADCLVACERLAARLDLMRAELQALPPVDPAELEDLYAAAGAEAALPLAVIPCDPEALGSDTL
jgi:hypothetical protein